MESYKESLIEGLEKLLADPKCFLLGEDIADPYGGAYTITKGMSAKFPGKIIRIICLSLSSADNIGRIAV